MSEPASSPVAIGWGAIVIPAQPQIQQIVIKESDRARTPEVDRVVRFAMDSYPGGAGLERMGVLTSFLVEIAGRDPAAPLVGATAALISEELGRPYWWVEAQREGGGIRTSIFPLEANSVSSAVAAFQAEPTVRMLKMARSVLDLMQDFDRQ